MMLSYLDISLVLMIIVFLQKGIDALQHSSQEWLLKLNISKCDIVSFGRSVDKSYMYSISQNNQNVSSWCCN